MIIKDADDHGTDVVMLQGLLDHPTAKPAVRKKIESEILRIRAGVLGEEAAAYEINRQFADNDDFAVIHDLRILVGDQVAQIDHILINRQLVAFLCETKNFTEGLGCNEQGEWVGFRNGKPFAIASPLDEGKRHCELLRHFLEQKHAWQPRRLGECISLKTEHFVLVSNTARISMPKDGAVPDMGRVTKIEAFAERRQKVTTELGFAEHMARRVSSEDLLTFAEGLASCHVPAAPDWNAKFGLKVRS